MSSFISSNDALYLLKKIQSSGYPYVYDYPRHRIILEDAAGHEQLHFRLPITLPPPGAAENQQEQGVNYVLLLIQSGSCALGYFEQGLNLDHKVFRAYMVRKKQGKSQIKHLKTKGKSRAGSRVRLSETLEFFENINQRLQEYFQEHEVHRIALSCSKTLIPYLFNAKVPTPFDKRDERIYRIPKHIHTPIYDVLLDTNKFLLKGELIFEEAAQDFLASLLEDIE